MSNVSREQFAKGSHLSAVVPTTLDAQTSPTSDALTCYSRQVFSKNLQRFMIDYSLKVQSRLPQTDKI